MKTLPVCYFPTTVLMIDDHQAFLQAIELQLDDTVARYEFYTNPVKALEYLNAVYQKNPFTNRCLFKNEEENIDHRTIELSIPSIYKEIYNNDRFKQISTVIVDYNMPPMDGLEFCAGIIIPSIQKVLLTGTATDTLAVKAFNEGTIQGYLQKQDPDIFDKLQETVVLSQKRYFIALSQMVLDSVLLHTPDLHALKDPKFINYFEQFVQYNNIKEYYLLDDQGSFLAIKTNGERCGLYVYGEIKMQGLLELAINSEGISEEVIQRIKNGEILCYHNRDEHAFPEEEEWQNHLYSTHVIQGQQRYHCALVPDIFDMDQTL